MRAPLFQSSLLFALLLRFGTHATGQRSALDWKLDHVTCHEVGALLTYESSMQSAGGEWNAVLAGVPSDANVSSVQVELPEGMRLVSVNQTNVLPDVADDLAWLAKQVEAKQLALDLERALLAALDQERAFLESNRAIGGGGEVLLVDGRELLCVLVRHRILLPVATLAHDRVLLLHNGPHLVAKRLYRLLAHDLV